MEIVISHPFKARTSEELIALLSAVATAILAVIIIMMLYFGREIIIPIALAILLSFVLSACRAAPTGAGSPRLCGRQRGYLRLRTHICDGEPFGLTAYAIGRRSAPVSIHDQRENPVISRHDGWPGDS